MLNSLYLLGIYAYSFSGNDETEIFYFLFIESVLLDIYLESYFAKLLENTVDILFILGPGLAID